MFTSKCRFSQLIYQNSRKNPIEFPESNLLKSENTETAKEGQTFIFESEMSEEPSIKVVFLLNKQAH